jgi:hypothetical protein
MFPDFNPNKLEAQLTRKVQRKVEPPSSPLLIKIPPVKLRSSSPVKPRPPPPVEISSPPKPVSARSSRRPESARNETTSAEATPIKSMFASASYSPPSRNFVQPSRPSDSSLPLPAALDASSPAELVVMHPAALKNEQLLAPAFIAQPTLPKLPEIFRDDKPAAVTALATAMGCEDCQRTDELGALKLRLRRNRLTGGNCTAWRNGASGKKLLCPPCGDVSVFQ